MLSESGYDVEILCTYDFGSPAYELNLNIKVTYLTSVLPNRSVLSRAVRERHFLRQKLSMQRNSSGCL